LAATLLLWPVTSKPKTLKCFDECLMYLCTTKISKKLNIKNRAHCYSL
jgi:hypothetical protein